MNAPPNVLLFLTDDHAAWALAHAGCTEIQTPNLDRLAGEGVRFTNALTPCPVCSPARASLMTGLMPSEHGIHDWIQEYDPEIGDRPWLKDIPTLPEMYKEAGYTTALSGKWHLGFHEGPPPGFDWTFGMDRKINSHNGTNTYFLNGKEKVLEGNRSRLITDHAIDFLQNRSGEKPFFLNVAYFATHSPFMEHQHDPDVLRLYENAEFPQMPRIKPHSDRKPENGIPGEAFDEEEARKRWRGYFAAVTEIDREVGRILNTLEKSGELDNTLIIYTADHGLCLGHHGVWGKGNGTRPVNFYEESLKVPLILKGPGIPVGKTINNPLTHIHLHQWIEERKENPTAQLPSHSEKSTYHEYGPSRCIRSQPWKWISREENDPGQLSTISSDPQEDHNFRCDSAHPGQADSLRKKLEIFFSNHKYSGADGRDPYHLPKYNDHQPW